MTGIKKHTGFTIVELILVIAILGVIVLITVFGFSSWRERTATTEVKNELQSAAIALKDQMNFSNSYPATSAAFTTLYKPKADVTLTYSTPDSGASYCLKAQSNVVGTVVWYINSTTSQTPTINVCP